MSDPSSPANGATRARASTVRRPAATRASNGGASRTRASTTRASTPRSSAPPGSSARRTTGEAPATQTRVAGPPRRARTARPASPTEKRVAPASVPSTRVHVRSQSIPAEAPTVRLPVVGWTLPIPPGDELPWIVGLAAMAALSFIDWPVAIVVAVGHSIAVRSHNADIRELAEGIEAGI